jgi:hypothetical protein
LSDLGHAHRAFAEQPVRDLALRRIVGKSEGIARRKAMVDHQAGKQEPAAIAAHLLDAASFPGQRNGACDMIKQAGCAPRIGLVVAVACDLARKVDGMIGE